MNVGVVVKCLKDRLEGGMYWSAASCGGEMLPHESYIS